jgi:hypothetical protein
MNENVMTKALEDVYNIVSKNNNNSTAKAFGVDLNAFTTATMIGEGEDIYDLLEEINLDKKQSMYDFVAVMTTGWAAPLDENGEIEGAPSKHKDRRRVTLLSIVDIKQSELASLLKFDDEEEMVYDFGSATGSLNIAMLSLAE